MLDWAVVMDESGSYSVTKAFRRLPRHACYACKRADIEGRLQALETEAPFDSLLFGLGEIPEAARGGKVPASFEVATAREYFNPEPTEYDDFRRVSRWLKIQIIPREFIRPVREALVREGLDKLLRWLDARRTLPATAHGRNHAMHVEFVVADGVLRTWAADAPTGSDP